MSLLKFANQFYTKHSGNDYEEFIEVNWDNKEKAQKLFLKIKVKLMSQRIMILNLSVYLLN